MPFRTVTVIGGGGNLGPSILDALVPRFTVQVVSRESSKSTFPSVKVVKIADNYPRVDLVNILKEQDVVVSLLSTFALADQMTIIDAAAEAGVKRFIPSEFGTDTRNGTLMEVPIFKVKNDVLKHLQSKTSQGMTWTAIATSAWFDWGLHETCFLRFDVPNRTAQVLDSGDDKHPLTNVKTIGVAVEKALLKPEETENRYLLVQSFHVSGNEIIAELEKVCGKFKVEKLDSETFLAEAMRKIQSPESIDEHVDGLYRAVYAHVVKGPDFQSQPDFANDLLEMPTEDIGETVKRIAIESKSLN